LSTAPQSPNPEKIIVAFAGSSADYFFSGFAEVATLQGNPVPNEENRVIFAVQSMKIPTQTGVRYLAIGSMDIEFINGSGRVHYQALRGQLLKEFPNAPTSEVKSPLLRTFPRTSCLSDTQFDWTKW